MFAYIDWGSPMNLKSVFIAVLLIVFGLPLAGMLAIQLFGMAVFGIFVSPVAEYMNAEERRQTARQAELDLIVTNSRENLPIYKSIQQFDELSNVRRASISVVLNENAVRLAYNKLATGSENPGIDAMLAAAASQIAAQECKLLQSVFAKECTVTNSQSVEKRFGGRTKQSNQRYFEIGMQMRFTQQDEFGQFKPDTRVKVERIKLAGKLSRSYPVINLGMHEGSRKQFYTNLRDSCRSVKAQRGNCAIQTFSVRGFGRLTNKVVKQAIKGSATMIVLDFVDDEGGGEHSASHAGNIPSKQGAADRKLPVFRNLP